MGVFSAVGISSAYRGFQGGYSGHWERAQAGARGYTGGHWAGSQTRSAVNTASRAWGGRIGKSLRYGALEAVGFDVGAGGANSWMGGRQTLGHFAKGRIGSGLGSMAMRGGIGLGFTAYMAYEGYQQEGMWGAMKGAGESVLWNAGFRLAGSLLPGVATVAGTALAGAAVIGGAYAFQRNAVDYNEKLRRSEFVAGNINDPFGNVATMRQRSIRALHNSNMGGRMTLGREAQLLGG